MKGERMHSFWLVLFLLCICATFLYVEAAKSRLHSGRIPSNVKIYPKSELTRSLHRPIYSNERKSLLESPQLSTSDPESKVPPSLSDLLPQHKTLYNRALQKDYDFAQFGKDCKVFTADEVEAFLAILGESVEPHEGQAHVQRTSPQETGVQLERLFNHSRVMCDFRKLLTCDKHLLTCACAHPSMGVDRDGVCGINIGHPCEIPGRTLLKHGLPITVSEMSPIKCILENAECVLESEDEILGAKISPIRKVCKCRNGFSGATCSRRNDPEGPRFLPPENQKLGSDSNNLKAAQQTDVLSEEVGRPIWMDEIGASPGEYFMHPEDIRDKLVELMDEEEMFAPEIRRQEAQKLVKIMEMDVDKEEMVINELHLRKLARLQHGDACDPERQVILDNPPVSKDAAHRWIDPNPQDIKSWQLGLLQAKIPLCNVHKLLRCNKATKVCECRPGLELDPKGKKSSPCKIPLGHNCDADFEPILEFDPLKDRKRFSEMDPPDCMPGTECTDKPLFFQKKCWCSFKFNCDKNAFDDERFTKMAASILRSHFTLKLGDSCDPKIHERLLSYRNTDSSGHEERLLLVQEIVENPETQFCDIESYLNCSDVSRTCECWKQLQPSQRKDGEYDCVAMNMASCGRTFKYGKYMYTTQGSQLWQVEKTFKKQFLPGCVPGAKCTGGDNPEWAGRCLCVKPEKTGETCSDSKSILATAFRADLIPHNDIDEMDILRIYFDLNSQTALMEQLMTAGVNDVCDPSTGLTLDRLMKFWREIANSSNISGERQTLPYFIAATKWTKFLVSTVQGKSASLCNATVGLRCHRTTGRCGCRRGARWIGDKCYLEPNEHCNHKSSTAWVATCMEGTVCSPVQEKRFTSYSCMPCQKKGKNDCVPSSTTTLEDEEDIWNVWNVHDDKDAERVEKKTVGIKQKDMKISSGVKEKPISGVKEKPISGVKEKPISGVKEKPISEVGTSQLIKSDNIKHKGVVGIDERNKEKEIKKNAWIKTTQVDKKTTTDTPKKKPLPSSRVPEPSSNAVDDLNSRQKDAYIQEILHMLKEIVQYRHIPFGESCIIEDEEKLAQVFPTLPVYDLEHLPTSIPTAYAILSRLYWKGISFCNRNLFLKCTNDAVCGCSFGFGLVVEEGECRLKERSYCDRESVQVGKRSIDFFPEVEGDNKNRHPVFQCQKGTKCTQIDYGLPICVRDNNDLHDEDSADVELGKQQNLNGPYFSDENDNLLPDVNVTGKVEPNGSASWGREQVSLVEIVVAVAVRMIITWAFV